MNENFHDDSYEALITACREFAKKVEEICTRLNNAVQDCEDNCQDTDEGPIIREKMDPHIAAFEAIAERASQLAEDISAEQGDGDEAGGKLGRM